MDLDLKKLDQLWDDFLKRWPAEDLPKMRLEDYSRVKKMSGGDSFTYWLEFALDELGGIGGGSSHKFVIFHRSPKKAPDGSPIDQGYEYPSKESGKTDEEVFLEVRSALVQVVEAVRRRDLETVEAVKLPSLLKWKTAFLYQDRRHPVCPALYSDALLRKASALKKATHLEALRALMAGYDGKEHILRFSSRFWEKWLYQDYDPKITKKKWLELLNDPQIGTPATLMVLSALFRQGGDATCSELAQAYGGTHQIFNEQGRWLGERVMDRLQLSPPEDSDREGRCCWVIPFKGRYVQSEIDVGRSGGFIWKLRSPLRKALEEMDLPDEDEIRLWAKSISDKEEKGEKTMKKDAVDDLVELLQVKKNLILQGAPGTGKTYAVPEIVTRLCGLTKQGDARETIAKAYDELKKKGRVVFTTFHPSLDYEHFVEGWRPTTKDNEDENEEAADEPETSFTLRNGIFKDIALRAADGVATEGLELSFPEGTRVWKVSLAQSRENELRDDCLTHGRIRIDLWGNEAHDLNDVSALIDARCRGSRPLHAFCNRMKKGDVVVSCYSSTQTDAVGIVVGDCEFLSEEIDRGYPLSRKVKWLWKGEPVEIADFMDGYSFTLNTVYSITNRFTTNRVLLFLSQRKVLRKPEIKHPPFVLVIDEINRGNISKIFGELITLLEPDKRRNGVEGETCRLAYSNREFGVPPNLYVIGTMNTADRSIGMLDYALRRRFVFHTLTPKALDANFARDAFLKVSRLFVKDPEAASPEAECDTLSEEFDPLDVWPGHSYFITTKETDVKQRWRYEIRPLLLEYVRDGVLKPKAREKIRELDKEFGL